MDTTAHRPPLNLPDAAAYLGISQRHLRELVYRRAITHTKVGGRLRFLPDQLDAYLAAHTVQAVS